jgi:DNA-binding transcriptional ArsR family regulator
MTNSERKILTLVVGKAGDLHFANLVEASGLDRSAVSAALSRLTASGLVDYNRWDGYTAYPSAWAALAA